MVRPAVVVTQYVSLRTLVRVVSAAVFVDPADQADQGKTGRDVDDPEPVSYTHLTLPTTPYV